METKIINNRYELIACTAIATEAEFNIWQDAEAAKIVVDAGIEQLVLVGWDACLGDAFCVYFGYTLDELADSIEDADYPDFSDDTLATVRIDGQPISAYCF